MGLHGRILLGAVGLSASLSLAAQTPVPAKPVRPMTYGASVVSYLRVPAVDFLPTNSAHQYGGGLVRYCTNCTGDVFAAALHLPAGAHVVYLELDYADSGASSYVLGELRECDYLGGNCSYHPTTGVGDPDCAEPGYICSGLANHEGNGYVFA